jgi:site-specific DNA-methyltransferase (adenine-specific)
MIQHDMKNKEERIHPTQKPVKLYDWIFKNFAKEGDKILDTHLGSGSSRIAADKAKLYFTASELDPTYYANQEKRFLNYKSQMSLW